MSASLSAPCCTLIHPAWPARQNARGSCYFAARRGPQWGSVVLSGGGGATWVTGARCWPSATAHIRKSDQVLALIGAGVAVVVVGAAIGATAVAGVEAPKMARVRRVSTKGFGANRVTGRRRLFPHKQPGERRRHPTARRSARRFAPPTTACGIPPTSAVPISLIDNFATYTVQIFIILAALIFGFGPHVAVQSPLPGQDVRRRPHLPGQVLAGLGFGRLTHLLFCVANGAAQTLDRLVGFGSSGFHRLALRAELLQELGELVSCPVGPGNSVLERFDHGPRLRRP